MSSSVFSPKHFKWEERDRVGVITLNRPERKNPLTFDSYAELRDTFVALKEVSDIRAVVVTGAGGNFCSGGDVHEIIGPLLKMTPTEQLEFTEMTGDLIIAMLTSPQPVIAAVDGICVGAGAAIAMASDIRFGTPGSKLAFLFVKVGLAGCDMGACSLLPRIIGQGRAAELLYTGRVMKGAEAHTVGFYNRLVESDALMGTATAFAQDIADGPTQAHAMTKHMLVREWDINVIDAVREEAKAQAACMQTNDFQRAYEAFVKKETPRFEGD